VFSVMGTFLEKINPWFPTPCTMRSGKRFCR
jgi:hypothetical protein